LQQNRRDRRLAPGETSSSFFTRKATTKLGRTGNTSRVDGHGKRQPLYRAGRQTEANYRKTKRALWRQSKLVGADESQGSDAEARFQDFASLLINNLRQLAQPIDAASGLGDRLHNEWSVISRSSSTSLPIICDRFVEALRRYYDFLPKADPSKGRRWLGISGHARRRDCQIAIGASAKRRRLRDFQAAATAVRHVSIATARSARCV
jgi:hypothetical protein